MICKIGTNKIISKFVFIEICTVEKYKYLCFSTFVHKINWVVFRFQGNMKYRHIILNQKPSNRCPNLKYFVFN